MPENTPGETDFGQVPNLNLSMLTKKSTLDSANCARNTQQFVATSYLAPVSHSTQPASRVASCRGGKDCGPSEQGGHS